MSALPSPPAPPPMRIVRDGGRSPWQALKDWWRRPVPLPIGSNPPPFDEFGLPLVKPPPPPPPPGTMMDLGPREKAPIYPQHQRLRGIVGKVSILKRGRVSVVIRFDLEDRERAQRLTPGTVLEVAEVRQP